MSSSELPESSDIDGSSQFFSQSQNRAVLEEALTFMEMSKGSSPGDSKKTFVEDASIEIVKAILDEPEVFNKRCRINIAHLGERLLDYLQSYEKLGEDNKELVFGILYRFLLELQIASSRELNATLSSIIFSTADFEFQGKAASQIKYADHQMIVEIIRGVLHHPRIDLLKDLPESIDRSISERQALEQSLSEREFRVKTLEETLKKHETAFNFVGLYEGFRRLRDTKLKESNLRLTAIMLLGIAMVLPILLKIYLIFSPLVGITLGIYDYICFVTLELILVFFFRVALHGRKSVKAQLVQLDLRMALCQFIQNYAEYAIEVRKGDPGVLDRFEQVIFSGIVTSESAIPSSFDGLDQVAGLISKLKDGR